MTSAPGCARPWPSSSRLKTSVLPGVRPADVRINAGAVKVRKCAQPKPLLKSHFRPDLGSTSCACYGRSVLRGWLLGFSVLVWTAAGCSESGQTALERRCRGVVRHVAIDAWPPQIRPNGRDLATITAIVEAAVARCRDEGLSAGAERCLLAGTVDDHFAQARACLGDRQGWPSWFNGSGVAVGGVTR